MALYTLGLQEPCGTPGEKNGQRRWKKRSRDRRRDCGVSEEAKEEGGGEEPAPTCWREPCLLLAALPYTPVYDFGG